MVFMTQCEGSLITAAWAPEAGTLTVTGGGRVVMRAWGVGSNGARFDAACGPSEVALSVLAEDVGSLLAVLLAQSGKLDSASGGVAGSPHLAVWRCDSCRRRAATERRWIGIAICLSVTRLAKAIMRLPASTKQTRGELEGATAELRQLSRSLLRTDIQTAARDPRARGERNIRLRGSCSPSLPVLWCRDRRRKTAAADRQRLDTSGKKRLRRRAAPPDPLGGHLPRMAPLVERRDQACLERTRINHRRGSEAYQPGVSRPGSSATAGQTLSTACAARCTAPTRRQ